MRLLETSTTNAFASGDPESMAWAYFFINHGLDQDEPQLDEAEGEEGIYCRSNIKFVGGASLERYVPARFLFGWRMEIYTRVE